MVWHGFLPHPWRGIAQWFGVLLVCSVFAPIWAAPFRNLHVPFVQPDGTRVVVVGTGDEFYAEFETADGYSVVFDPVLRAYCFAELSADGSLTSSGHQIHLADPVRLGIKKYLRMSGEVRKRQVFERWQRWEAGVQIQKRWTAQKAALHQMGPQAKGLGPDPGPPPSTTTGLKLGLTLLIDFDDDPATVPQAEIINFCNGDAYTGFGNNGSVKKYFLDNSNDLLTYSNVVTVYIRIPNSLHPKSWYNNPAYDCGDQGNKLVGDAIQVMKALPNYYSEILPAFADLTVDSNNRVMACNIFYAGGNGGVWDKGLWPNSWSLVNIGEQELLPGGKKVWDYQISNIGTSLELGTFCHENGHMLCGFPDIYDYDTGIAASAGGAGKFCLMNSGSHGPNPAQICAYLKRAAGWATTTELTSASVLTATLRATAGTDFNHFYRYQKPGVATEYFLVECRYATGRDATLPGSGVAVWHIDELGDHNNQSLVPNTTHSNYEVTLVQADNQWHFELNVNSGDANDLFSNDNGAPGYTNVFSDGSLPSAQWWDGSPSGVVFHDFSSRSTRMSFMVGYAQAAPQILIQPQSQTAIIHQPVSFAVSASGTPPLSFQWFLKGSAIAGATTSTYSLASAESVNQGDYFVTVSNPYGSVTSAAATLKVLAELSLSQALDTTNLVWSTGGSLPWQAQVSVAHDGVDAVVTGPISDNQETWLETAITNGPGTLSFWWKVDSETGYDLLRFEIDGVENDAISGPVGWTQKTCAMGAGTHLLRWRYTKDDSVNMGADRGWLDQVSFTPGTVVLPPTLAEALDGPGLLWSTGGSAQWFGQTGVTYDGVDAAQSGPITHSQESWLETTVTGAGMLSFSWKVSSEEGYDFLRFEVDAIEQATISGEAGWIQQGVRLGEGMHSLRWVYSKDLSLSGGLDRGWVDNVSFVPDVLLPSVLSGAAKLPTGEFQFRVDGSPGGAYVVLGSSDLSTWVALATNTAPFTFTDSAAALSGRRFYQSQATR